MEINQLKKELGLSQQDLADFFDVNDPPTLRDEWVSAVEKIL